MNKRVKKGIKITLITIAAVLVLVLGTVGYAVNVVLSPEKLTPMVNNILKQSVRSEVTFESVEVTAFRTFPHFGLSLKNGVVYSATTIGDTLHVADSLHKELHPFDKLLSFERLEFWINPIRLLFHGEVKVDYIEIDSADIYCYIDPQSKPNWDIFAESAPSDTLSSSATTSAGDIEIKNFFIKRSAVVFDDRASGVYARMKDLNLDLKGMLGRDSVSKVSLKLDFRDALLWQDSALVFKKLNIGLETDIAGNRDSLKLNRAKISVNDIGMNMQGWVTKDSVDFTMGMAAADINALLGMIPESVIDKKVKYTSSGEFQLDARIRGAYRDGKKPDLDAEVAIKNGKFEYNKMPQGIDALNLALQCHLDLNRPQGSFVTIRQFDLQSLHTHLNLSGRIEDLFGNPKIDLTSSVSLSLEEISRIFPFAEGVTAKGDFYFKGRSRTNLEQVKRGDYARMGVEGVLKVNGIRVRIPQDSLFLKTDNLAFDFTNSTAGLLNVSGHVDSLMFRYKRLARIRIESAKIDMKGFEESDSTSYLDGKIDYTHLSAALLRDTVGVLSTHSLIQAKWARMSSLRITSDTLVLRYLTDSVSLNRARINMQTDKKSLQGRMQFAGMRINTRYLSLPIYLDSTTIAYRRHNLTLRNAVLRIGESDLRMTGTVSNLFPALKGEKPFEIKSDIYSKNLNLNQLLNAYRPDPAAPDSVTAPDADTVLRVFVVPKNIDFELKSRFDHIRFGEMAIDSVKGKIVMRDSEVLLQGLGLNTLGAYMRTSLQYRAADSTGAYTRFVLNADKIDVHSVIRLIPSLDTILPMIKSLEGTVSLGLTADARFDSLMNVDVPSVNGVISIQGSNLHLLDGEVFAEISKMLFFKKKAKNSIEEVSVQIDINKGVIEVFPFLLEINRYKLAVGGEYKLNNEMNYHISILKSPIPFKMGVNITGTIDDYKIRFGKAKYKFLNEPTQAGVINPRFLKRWDEISKGLLDVAAQNKEE